LLVSSDRGLLVFFTINLCMDGSAAFDPFLNIDCCVAKQNNQPVRQL